MVKWLLLLLIRRGWYSGNVEADLRAGPEERFTGSPAHRLIPARSQMAAARSMASARSEPTGPNGNVLGTGGRCVLLRSLTFSKALGTTTTSRGHTKSVLGRSPLFVLDILKERTDGRDGVRDPTGNYQAGSGGLNGDTYVSNESRSESGSDSTRMRSDCSVLMNPSSTAFV